MMIIPSTKQARKVTAIRLVWEPASEGSSMSVIDTVTITPAAKASTNVRIALLPVPVHGQK